MDLDPASNPGFLKLDLFCNGLRIDPGCERPTAGGRPILRTRAGLGSGLELVLPGKLWVNVPVTEAFAERSPYLLVHRSGRFAIERGGRHVAFVSLPRRPAFYSRKTTSGRSMSRVGVLQGTYLGVYPTAVCAHWLDKPKKNCRFCSVGLNLGSHEDKDKSVRDVVETVVAARRETGITYVHFNTGYYEGDTYLDELEPFIVAVKRATGLLIGVQTPPHPDLSRYRRLRKLGVNQVSFCFELWDGERFEHYCPGKAAKVGLERHLAAIEYCARIFDTTNGEIIAGLEPVESTLEAIDWITSVGAIPTVCVFRPLVGTELASLPPPETTELVPVFRHLYERCVARGLPIGIAPNVNVSIILKPEECRWFSHNPRRPRWSDAKAFVMRQALRGALSVASARARLRSFDPA